MSLKSGIGFWLITFGLTQGILAQSDTIQQVQVSRANSTEQQEKPYVILISVDGLRYDYAKKFHAENLLRLGQTGAMAQNMISSFPSVTFPNHYTIVTGLYPAHHGLVDNSFYDYKYDADYDIHNRKKVEDSLWYGGIPLWVLAENQKMLSASFYWVGSDAAIDGVRPTYSYHYNEKLSPTRRIAIVKEWLNLPAERRPHLITFYFPEVDHESHTYGPDADETRKVVLQIDNYIGKLSAIADSLRLPVNFIVVSDHGMTVADFQHPIPVPQLLNDSSVCRITTGSTLLHVYLRDKTKIISVAERLRREAIGFEVYSTHDTPTSWHYNDKNDRYGRLGDLLLSSRIPGVFKVNNKPITPGKHGYDPLLIEMRATFVAWGPNIRQTRTLKPFENVHVYPLIAKILGLTYHHQIDGDLSVLQHLYKKN